MARLKDKDGTPAWKWGKKASSVNVANLNSNIIEYFGTLPQELQSKILATSGNDSGHAKTSRHYSDKAIDLRFDDAIWQYMAKDPNRLKYGLTLIDPNHGSGKHIHLSHGDGTENQKDVWVNPYSDKAKEIIGAQNNPSPVPSVNPSMGPQIIMQEDTKRTEFLQGLQEQIRYDSELDAQQKQLLAAEQARQQALIERTNERNNILDAIGNNNLEFEGRNFKPNQQFAEGGRVVEDLDSDIGFMINSIKANTPQIETPEYLSLLQENEAVQNRLNSTMQLYQTALSETPTNQTTIINNPSTGALPATVVENPANEAQVNLEKLSPTKSLLYSELKNLGLNNIQIAGAIGSLGGESHEHLDSTVYNKQGSGAFGIAQWLGPRYRNLVKFASDNGMDFKTPEAQAKFLVHELKGTHKGVLNSMLKAKTLPEATEVWTRKFEIPSEREIRESMGRRVNFANNFLKSIS